MAKRRLKQPEIKKPTTSRTVKIQVTCQELIDARDSRGDKCIEHPRELVAEKFLEKNYVVSDFTKLVYFNKPWGWIVEGNTSTCLLPKL